MSSIFDENSEFLKYIRQKESNGNSDSSTQPDIEKAPASSTTPSPDSQSATVATESYLLDLKTHSIKEASPVEEVPIKKLNSTTPPPTPKNVKKVQNLKTSSSGYSGPLGFILEKLKLLFVSALIFVVTFVGFNWNAYYSIVNTWYQDKTGQNLNSPIAQFSGGNTETTMASNLDFIDNTDIPKLNLEVAPPGYRVIIPRLQSNVPVMGMSTNTLISRNWNALEKEMQEALRDGVVHYPGTPFPNQSGNVVLTGHSSYYPWDPGRFKDVFAILHQAVIGDEIIIFHNQQRYNYKITDIKVVQPTEVNVLGDMGDDRLTLITCTPIGTNLRRLIVTAKPVK
jgi:LPXTG-site transpeptidase (sortase) family protein